MLVAGMKRLLGAQCPSLAHLWEPAGTQSTRAGMDRGLMAQLTCRDLVKDMSHTTPCPRLTEGRPELW